MKRSCGICSGNCPGLIERTKLAISKVNFYETKLTANSCIARLTCFILGTRHGSACAHLTTLFARVFRAVVYTFNTCCV